METKARSFKELEKEKKFEQLCDFAKKVTELYATTPKEYSQPNVAQDNNLTEKALRKLMDYAIQTAQVSLEIAEKVLEKSIQNQQRKHLEAGGSSMQHHKKLMKQRVEFIAYGYTNAEIRKIAADIANNPKCSLEYFTKKYDIESVKVIKLILQRAIEEDISSDEEMEKIIERSLKGNSSERAKEYFENLQNKRNEKRNSQ